MTTGQLKKRVDEIIKMDHFLLISTSKDIGIYIIDQKWIRNNDEMKLKSYLASSNRSKDKFNKYLE